MTNTVYPRSMDFGTIPAGVQSAIQWAHLTNHDTGAALDRDDWGIDGHFTSRRPALRQMNPAALTELRTNAPASGNSRWVYGYGEYVFEGNTTTGIGVFKVDATGLAVEVSRYTSIVPSATGGGFYHDGRFLYVRNPYGLHVLKLDKYDNLILCDIIEPHGHGVECVHGFGSYIFTGDSTGVASIRVDHQGQATVIDTVVLANVSRIWSRDGWVFALTATTLKSYAVDAAGFLTLKDTITLGAGAHVSLTGDEKFIYITDDTGASDLRSYTIDSDGVFSLADAVTMPVSTHYSLYFDGGYLQVSNGHKLNSYSVDRSTGVMNLILTNESYGPEELTDGDMEAGPGPEELTDGDMEAGPGPEELTDGDMEAGPGPEELTDGDMEAGPGPEELTDGDMEAGPGPEELTDGDMEAAGTAAWTSGASAVLSKQTGTPHGGSQCLRVAYNGVSYPWAEQTTTVIGRTYRFMGWARGDGSKSARIQDGSVNLWSSTVANSWQAFDVTYVATTTKPTFLTLTTAAGYSEFDDCSVVETCPDWTPGNNAQLTKSTASPHGGSQALRVTYTSSTNPYAAQTIVTIGRTYRVTGWARGDGVAAPRVRDGGVSKWTGTSSTSWQAVDVIYVPASTDVQFNASGVLGPGNYCEFDDFSVVETCPDWTPGNSAELSKQTTTPHSGNQCLRVAYNGTPNPSANQTILTVGRTYRVTGWARSDGTQIPRVHCGGALWNGTSSTSWQGFDVTFVCSNTIIIFYNLASAGYTEFDSCSIVETCPDWLHGSAAGLTKETTSPHGGTQLLRVTSNGSWGYAYQNITTIGRTYRIVGWARPDGASHLPRVYDGTVILWTGTASTSWQAFDIIYVASANNIRLRTTANAGYTEWDDVSVKETCPDWIPINNPLLTKSTVAPHGGLQALRVTYGGTNFPYARQSNVTVVGRSYRITGWARGDGIIAPNVQTGSTTLWTGTTSLSWQSFDVDYVADTVNIFLQILATGAGYCEFDDFSIKETCPDWDSVGTPLLTKSTVSPHTGLQSLRVAYDGTSNPRAYQSVLTVSKEYRIFGWARGDGGSAYPRLSCSAPLFTGTTSNSWQYFDVIFTCASAVVSFYALATAAGYCEFDDVSIKELDESFYDTWFDGEKLVTARLEDGIGVFGFDDSRIRFPVYYTPLGYEQHAGTISVQGVGIPLKGESPATIDPYIVPASDSITLEADTRWDKITYQFYGSFDRLQDVKDANPQIPTEIKARLYVPRGAIVKKPGTVSDSDSSIGAVEWRRQ